MTLQNTKTKHKNNLVRRVLEDLEKVPLYTKVK